MIIVFAGAGASKAVSPKHYPTTIEFLDRLPSELKEHALYGRVLALLQAARGEEESPADIEQVLWMLTELADFLRGVAHPTGPVTSLVRQSANWGGGDLKGHFNQLNKLAPGALRVVQELSESLCEQVYESYSRIPSTRELDATWLPLLKELQATGDRVDVFTTNYDLVLEAAIDVLRERHKFTPLRTGRGSRVVRTLAVELWRDSTEAQLAPGLLTKLHGSVDWSRGRDQIFISDPMFKGSHRRHVIIYPGFKGAPKDPPFDVLHDYFRRACTQATHIVFIGFAFRDDYINEILRDYALPNARKIIIDPAEILPGIPFGEEEYTHLVRGFDRQATRTVLSVMEQTRPSN